MGDPSTENLETPTGDNEDSACIDNDPQPDTTMVQADYIPDRWGS